MELFVSEMEHSSENRDACIACEVFSIQLRIFLCVPRAFAATYL